MILRNLRLLPIILVLTGLTFFAPVPGTVQAQASGNVVRAVLFYSPTCPHCHIVINETLPPLTAKYGGRLQIAFVDITQPEGDGLFLAALDKFDLKAGGVPFLVVGDGYLFGSEQIPEEFPGLIDAYLAVGGVDWPDLPRLREALPRFVEADEVPASAPGLSPEIEPFKPGWHESFSRDPLGNGISVVVLVGMFWAVPWGAMIFRRTKGSSNTDWTRAIPALAIAGLAVAGYLAYVETAQVTAVCGPVGDCNAVQGSEYARLFGILPIGILGAAGYIAILAAWLVARYGRDRIADMAGLALLLMTAAGTLFSIYLTFLEPFVIGATCAWCLTSSILITAPMLLSVKPAKMAYSRLSKRRSHRRGRIPRSAR